MNTLLIMNRSIHNNLRSFTNILSFLVLVILLAGLSDYLGIRFLLVPALKTSPVDISRVRHLMAMVLYATSLFSLAMGLTVSVVRSLIQEKSRRMYETLLASPVELRQLWWAKSLSVFLPGYLAGLVLSLLTWYLMNAGFTVPVIGWVLTPPMVLIPVVLVPFLYLCLSFLVTLISLITDPVHGNALTQVFLPSLASLTFNLGLRGVLDTHTRAFFIFHLILAGLLLIIILLVRPRLTKQKVILSGRKS